MKGIVSLKFQIKGKFVDSIKSTNRTQNQSKTSWSESNRRKDGIKFQVQRCKKYSDHPFCSQF